MTTIKAVQCSGQECQTTTLDSLAQLIELTRQKDQFFWLDLESPTVEELTQLGQELHFHPLAIEDASSEHQRPKVEQYEHFWFIVFYTLAYKTDQRKLLTRELNMFVNHNFLVTVHYHPMPELAEAEQRWMRNPMHRELGVGMLIYTLLDTIVDGYFPVVDELVEQSEEISELIYAGNTRDSKLSFRLLEMKRMFLEVWRIIAPERDVLNVMTNRDSPLFHEKAMLYFRDIYDHITRLADTLDVYRDQLTGTMDANLAVVSNDLNKVMRTLTATSIILMSASLIAGIYGMNFDTSSPYNMPELHLPFGYLGALGLMLIISLILIMVFKRLKWF